MWFGVDSGLAGMKFSGSMRVRLNDDVSRMMVVIRRMKLIESFVEKKFLKVILSLLVLMLRLLDDPI